MVGTPDRVRCSGEIAAHSRMIPVEVQRYSGSGPSYSGERSRRGLAVGRLVRQQHPCGCLSRSGRTMQGQWCGWRDVSTFGGTRGAVDRHACVQRDRGRTWCAAVGDPDFGYARRLTSALSAPANRRARAEINPLPAQAHPDAGPLSAPLRIPVPAPSQSGLPRPTQPEDPR